MRAGITRRAIGLAGLGILALGCVWLRGRPARPAARASARATPAPATPAPLRPETVKSMREGKEALERGDLKASAAAFARAAQQDPQSPLVYDWLGVAYLRQNRFDEALRAFQEEIRLAPSSGTGWARIADIYYNQQRFTEAVQALEKAVQIEPQVAQNHYNLAMLYPQLLDLNRAVAALDRYVALKPEDPYAHYQRGSLLYKLARLDEAERALIEAIRLEPRARLYHFALAQVYFRRTPTPETTQKVLAELEKALGDGEAGPLAPEPAAVYYYIGLCYQRRGDWETARRALTEATARAPEAWGAYYALASVLKKLGRRAEAQKADLRFVQLRQAEDRRMQRAFYEQEVRRNPDRADTRFQLADFLARQGERAAALQALATAQQLATPEQSTLKQQIRDLARRLKAARQAAPRIAGAPHPSAREGSSR